MFEQEWLELFADGLKYAMETKGYSVRELAEAVGVSPSTISRYLNAKQMPSVKNILNMSEVLDEDLNDFLYFGDLIL